MTASATEIELWREAESGKGRVTGSCFSEVIWEWATFSSWRLRALLGHILELYQAAPVLAEAGNWDMEIGAACLLAAFRHWTWPGEVYGLTLPTDFMTLSHDPTEEIQSQPFLRGCMWYSRQLYVQVQGNVIMPSPRTLLIGCFSTQWCTETAGKDVESNAGCELHHWSVRADDTLHGSTEQLRFLHLKIKYPVFSYNLIKKNLTAMIGIE